MAPKRREKTVNAENNVENHEENQEETVEDCHEIEPGNDVLGKFRRSTQVYRLVFERNRVQPIFLYRTLTYMRKRMSRSHGKRRNFKVDSILATKSQAPVEKPSKYMTITYMGYYDDSISSSGEKPTVRIETIIRKKANCRRKDSNPPLKLSMGTTEVPVNPQDDDDSPVPILSIAPETICLNNSAHRRTLVIQTVCDEPLECTYELFNSKGQCQLPEGMYEGTFLQHHGIWVKLDHASKQLIQDHQVKTPKIKFHFEWTTDSKSGWVPRPQVNSFPLEQEITPKCPSENKENRPAKRGGQPPRAARVSRGASTGTSAPMVAAEAEGSRVAATPPEEKMTFSINFIGETNQVATIHNSGHHCPFCQLNCLETYALFKHLKHCHERFNFTFHVKDNHVRIDVTMNEQADNSYEGNSYNLVSKREAVCRRTVWTEVAVCHPKRGRNSLADFLETEVGVDLEVQRPILKGHQRLYYHTTTCLPVHPRELDIDSEGEKDPKWLQQKTAMMIDDFTDVNEGEKAVIKMWNLHVLKHGFVGDSQIPLACEMFVESYGLEILKNNLYRNFLLHLCNLHDFALLSAVEFAKVVYLLQNILKNNPPEIEKMRKLIIEQRKSWIASGGAGGPRDKAARESPVFGSSGGPSTSAPSTSKHSSSSTFITGDGTLRRKMTLQTPHSVTKNKIPNARLVENEDEEPIDQDVAGPSTAPTNSEVNLRKRKLSMEDKPGDETNKRPRCGSQPVDSARSDKPLRRQSSDNGKPSRRKSSPPSSSDDKPLCRKSTEDGKAGPQRRGKSSASSDEEKAKKSEGETSSRRKTSPPVEGESNAPLRRKSSPPTDEVKPPMRKSVAP